MNYPSGTNLDRYKNACEALRDDINLAIQDRKFVREGGTLRYAVDFSEIFAYVLPPESFSDFILFPDAFDKKEEKDDSAALQQIILRYIFCDLPKEHKLILLSPYILEFRTFIRSLKDNVLDDLIRNAMRIFESLEKIASQKQNKVIASICKKIERHATIFEGENRILTEFVQNYGYIQSVLEEGISEQHPFQRVKQLNLGSVFSPLSDLIDLKPNVETIVYARWAVELRKSRPPERKSSAELDAVAINLIHEGNLSLEKNTRLILITRSESMHTLYQNEYKELWESSIPYYLLRRPRAFSIGLAVAQRSSDDIQDLMDLSSNIDLFLKTYDSWKQDKLQIDDKMLELINKIKQYWKQIQKTALPLSVKSLPEKHTDIRENAKIAKTILEYARSNKKVNKKIAERIDSLFYDLDRTHEMLGLDLHIPSYIQYKEYPDKWELRASSDLYPYKLYFETRFAKEIMEKLSKEKQRSIPRDIADIFTRRFDKSKKEDGKVDFESILIMAFLLGLLGKWQIAEIYCARAIKVGESENVSPHEALYFQAVCKREGMKSENWLVDSLLLLEKAIDRLQDQNDKESIEARYWIEQGIAILTAQQSNGIIPSPHSADKGLNTIEYWEEKLEDNLPLHLLILKSELDYFVANRRYRRLKRLKDKFKSLETSLTNIENNISNWPPYVVDVMSWGKWILFSEEYANSTQRERLIIQLEEAGQKGHDKKLKEDIAKHIEDIKKGEPY